MILEGPGEALKPLEVDVPEPGEGQVLLRVRRLQDGSARCGRGVVRTQSALSPGPPDSRHGREGRRAYRSIRGGGSGRGAVAGVDRRHVPPVSLRAREPLRERQVYAVAHRRRVRRLRGRRWPFLLPDPWWVPGSAGSSALVRGPDRTPL